MVTALHCLSYVSAVVGLIFVLLSLASGLLYIAEVIEEHSGLAKSIGKRLIYCIIIFYGILYWVDDLPFQLVGVGILAHLIYLTNFRRSWPTISLTSLSFIFSCVFVLLSHYLSFRHFSAKQSSSTHHYTRYNAYNHRRGAYGKKQDEGFLEVATFFAVCVWLVPFYLFLSLSANDNVLPSAGETPAASRRTSTAATPNSPAQPPSPTLNRHTRQRSSMMKSALSSAFSIVPSALRPSSLSSNLAPVSTGGGGKHSPSVDRMLRSPSPTIGFQPFSSGRSGGGNSNQREGLLVSSTSSPKSSSFFSSGQSGPWSSQPPSPNLGGTFPSSSSTSPTAARGLGLGMGNGATSPALRAIHPPGMPPRRHTTAGDEGFVSAAAGSDSVGMGYSASAMGRPQGGTGALGPIKRRGTGETSNLR